MYGRNVERIGAGARGAGLLKGSVSVVERPRTLRRLKNVCTPASGGGMGTGADVGGDRLDDGDTGFRLADRDRDRDRDEKTMSIMSPFDEQEEWAKISEIMASFGTGLVRESVFVTELEKEFQTRLGVYSDGSPCAFANVGQWLSKLNLADYESLFINYGYDDLEFINGVLDDPDLRDMGITSDHERAVIMDSASLLNNRVGSGNAARCETVEEWLKMIHLENYTETFKKHLYMDMDRVRRVWEVELAAVLEIQKPAHRKRILASVSGSNPRTQIRNGGGGPNLEDLNKDLNTLKTNIQQLKDEIRDKLPETPTAHSNGTSVAMAPSAAPKTTVTNTGTLRHRKNRPAPPPPTQKPAAPQNGAVQAPEKHEMRAPSELLLGSSSTLKTEWKHQPKDLVNGSVTYVANYMGSTVVKELRGTMSTKLSIQKLRKICRDPRSTPEITLSISYRGVRFLNTLNNEPICEHEIRNIHCACQDADDLTHFAYITKDHTSRIHFCHVFCVPTTDQATEVILTLGQAFEVAYQIALKEKLGNHAARSLAPNQLSNLVSVVSVSNSNATSHGYSSSNANNSEFEQNSNNPKAKPRSKSIPNPLNNASTFKNSTSAANSNSNACTEAPTKSYASTVTVEAANSNSTKLLVTHGRSHSVNDIKLNGNQMKHAPTPVDDIGIGVKDLKPGSRAPIALSEEL